MNTNELLGQVACKVRSMLFKIILKAGSGHLGGCSSSTELMTAMYFGGVLKYDPKNPRHFGRDRVIVRGHLGPLRYSIFNLLRWVDDGELDSYRKLGSRLQGHESMEMLPGVDITPSGMLGMVLSYGVGSAIALRKQNIQATTWVFLGDGEEQEGNVSEAARHAASIGIDNMVCIIDRNCKQLSQPTKDVDGASDLKKIWEGYGWNVEEIADGNSMYQIIDALKKPRLRNIPTLFIANTIKGIGLRDSEKHPSRYHTLSSCSVEIVQEAINLMETSISGIDFNNAVSELLSEVKRPSNIKPVVLSQPSEIKMGETNVPEEGLVDYLRKMIQEIKNNPLLRFYVLTADVTVKKLALACGFHESHVTYIDPGIREQHMLGIAHGIAVNDPNSIIMVMENDAFLFRAADQLNAICQAGSKMIIFGGDSGLCGDRNGATHQSVGQPGAMMNMCGLTFFEPSDTIDLENCLNWAIYHKGPVYIRLHDREVDTFLIPNKERRIDSYVVYEPSSKLSVIVAASGLPVREAIKLAKNKDRGGIGIRVINIISPMALSSQLAGLIEDNIPVLTVYNGNPDTLQSAVSKSVMENILSRPKIIVGHGFRAGTSGSIEDLLKYFRLDAEGIEAEIQRRFPWVM